MTAVFEPGVLPGDAVELGRLGEAWGIKGWSRLLPHSAAPEVLLSARHWWLQPPVPPHDRGFRAFSGVVAVAVAEVKPHADGLVVRLEGVGDRNGAEALKGARVLVARADFPAPQDPDEFYWVDLLGLQVVNREGVTLGVVRDLMATGPHSVLVLADERDGETTERLIPFVSAFVDAVDRSAGRITVDWQPDY